MARWEYRTVKLKVTGFLGGKVDESEVSAVLNDAGIDGWELAAAPAVNSGNGATTSIILMLKRPGR